jgi:hypothetical protein
MRGETEMDENLLTMISKVQTATANLMIYDLSKEDIAEIRTDGFGNLNLKDLQGLIEEISHKAKMLYEKRMDERVKAWKRSCEAKKRQALAEE